MVVPGQGGVVVTHEGEAAVRELFEELLSRPPVAPLHPSFRLTLAAEDHVRDQSRSGDVGHIGRDGTLPVDRVRRHGNPIGRIGRPQGVWNDV